MFGFRKRFRKKNLVAIVSPDGNRVYRIQKREVYDPLAYYLTDEQIPDFIDKFFGYIIELSKTDSDKAGELTGVLLNKLYGEEYDFVGELNSFTDKDGNVDWENFLKEEEE